MNCPRCEAEMKPGDAFCTSCGFRLPGGRRRLRLALFILVPLVVVAAAAAVPAYLVWGSPGDGGAAGNDPGKDAISVTVQAGATATERVNADTLERCCVILRHRLAGAGLAAYEVTSDGQGLITVRVPKVTDASRLAQVLSEGRLEFLDAKDFGTSYASEASALAAAGVASRPHLPEGTEIVHWGPAADSRVASDQWFVVTVSAKVDGSMVEMPKVGYESTSDRPKVELEFTAAGATAFADLTREMADTRAVTGQDQRLAIVLDGEVLSAPTVMSEIPDGAAEITGSFTTEEAKNLVGLIEYGRLPLVLTVLGPT